MNSLLTDNLLTIKETSLYLKVSRTTLRDFIKKRYFPYIRVGRQVRIKESEVNAYILAHSGYKATE